MGKQLERWSYWLYTKHNLSIDEEKNMKKMISKFNTTMLTAVLLFGGFWFTGCSENTSTEPGASVSTDKQAFETMAGNDEELASFEPAYNEEQAMPFVFGSLSKTMYPIKVGQRMIRVSRTMEVTQQGDTAYGTITQKFEGVLFVAASYDPANKGDFASIDTVVSKPFNTTITRRVAFVKVARTEHPLNNWRILAVSLPEGGTLTENVKITAMTISLPGGDTLRITSPLDYLLYRNQARRRHLPNISKGEEVRVRLEVRSAYADTDFVTLTFGADKKGLHRSKRLFTLVSSEFDGTYYRKVYENTWKSNNYMGHFHAIVNVMPRQVVYDDATAVESNTWGIPYYVK